MRVVYVTSGGEEKAQALTQDGRFFHLSGRDIVSVDLSQLDSMADLRSVRLSDNRLKSIDMQPLSNLRYLEALDLQGNELEAVDLSPLADCKGLASLILDSNHLLELDVSPLSECRSLKTLSLSQNFLKEIDVSELSGNTRLEKISIHTNDIDVLDLSSIMKLPRLKTLRCDSHVNLRANPLSWELRVAEDQVNTNTGVRTLNLRVLVSALRPIDGYAHEDRPTAEILAEGEGQTIEFKSSFRLDVNNDVFSESVKHDSIRTLCGFMNSDGGVLLLGVRDDGSVSGIEDEINKTTSKSQDKYQLHLRQEADRLLGRFNEKLIQVRFEPWGDTTICRLDVSRSSLEPVFLGPRGKDPQFWVRLGNSTKKLTGKDMLNYVKERWPEQFARLDDAYE